MTLNDSDLSKLVVCVGGTGYSSPSARVNKLLSVVKTGPELWESTTRTQDTTDLLSSDPDGEENSRNFTYVYMVNFFIWEYNNKNETCKSRYNWQREKYPEYAKNSYSVGK